MTPAVATLRRAMPILLLLAVVFVPPPGEAAWPAVELRPPHWSYYNWTFGDVVGYRLGNVTFASGVARLLNNTTSGWARSPDADVGRVLAPGEGVITWQESVPANTTLDLRVAGTTGNTSGEWATASWVVVINGSAVPAGFRYYRWNATLAGINPGETPSLLRVTLTVFGNVPPSAAVPGNLSAPRNTTAVLDGSASSDADGDSLGYQWAQIGGPATPIQNATASVASILPLANGTYFFSLNVTDGWATSTAVVNVTVTNSAPIADAGTPQSAFRNTTVVLNASASLDANGDPLAFLWSQTAGPDNVTITGPGQPLATVVPTGVGTYVFTVVVQDNQSGVDTASVSVDVPDQAPIANAGPDAAAFKNEGVTLDGTASTDSDGDPLNFTWVQLTGPGVVLTDPTTATPSFTAPTGAGASGVYVFELTVFDPFNGSSVDTVAVNVTNRAPNASAGPDQAIPAQGVRVFLDATASGDPDAETLSAYQWAQLFGPPGAVNNASSAVADFIAPMVGAYGFRVTVTDPEGANATDAVLVTVANALPMAALVVIPATVKVGVLAVLDGSASVDPDGTLVEYAFTFGDGSNSTGALASLAHAWSSPGMYMVNLTVLDNSGAVDTATTNVTVIPNVPPAAALAVSPSPVQAGRPAEVNASASLDPDGILLEYNFTFGDGSFSVGTQAVVTHAWAVAGLYTVGVTVRDDSGAVDSTSVNVTVVPNVLPVARATVSPGSGVLPTTFQFDGSASVDPDGILVDWAWDFGDGTPASGPVVSHRYSARGSYTATLSVTDEDGAVNTTSLAVDVLDQVPIAAAGPDLTGAKYVPIGLSATAWDPDGDLLAFEWIQRGGPSVVLVGPNTPAPIFTPVSSGLYRFQVWANDSFGGSGSDEVSVMVSNTPPMVDAGADRTDLQDTPVLLDGGGSTDADGDALAYRWTQTAGPGVTVQNANAAAAAFTTSVPAVYAFLLEVDDGDGGVATDGVAVTIINRVPSASLGAAPDQVVLGNPITFSGNASSDLDGAITEYAFDFGDGNLAAGASTWVTHAYGAPGAYVVTLRVTDSDGGTDLDQLTVVVSLPPSANAFPVAAMRPVPSRGNLSTTFSFDASPSTDPDGDPLTATWDFGDGATATGTAVTHRYLRRGWFTVTLRVDDGRGGSHTATSTLTVENRAPTASAGADRRAWVGEDLRITAAAADPDGDRLTYRWRLVRGPSAVMSGQSGPTVGLIPQEPGEFTLQVTVSDGFGGSDTVTVTITVELVESGWPWLLGLLLAAAFVGGFLGHEPNRVKLITIFLGAAYGRRLQEDPDLEVRGMIQGYLKAHPGDTFADIKRILALNNGSVSWHLMKLEKEGVIKSHVRDGRRRYYPKDVALPMENGGELYEVQRRLLREVEKDPGLAVSLLAEKMGMSSQLALYHLRKLSEKGYVNLERKAFRLAAVPGSKSPEAPQSAK